MLPERDHRRMYIHLDPDDARGEKGNENNIWEFNLKVQERTFRGPPYTSLTVLAVTVAGATMALIRRQWPRSS